MGTRSLDGIQRLAADVTGNGAVTALDAARILQFAVGIIGRFPVSVLCESDWGFSPAPSLLPNQTFAGPMIGAGACTGGSITFDPLSGPASGQDFTAFLFGDATGNWQSSGGGASGLVAF